tara:strand:- start:3138 stop:3530 length:393 start_codon:yes stop_codon:yes gene_type:complete
METTLLIKVLDESEGTALSFDMSDFDFLVWSQYKAFFWDQQDRFELLKSSEGKIQYNDLEFGVDISPEGKEDWHMHYVGEGNADALLAWKILLSNGYNGYLLWDPIKNEYLGGCYVILTDYTAGPTDHGA